MTRMLYCALVRDRPVERRDDVADLALARGVQGLQRDDVRLRRNRTAIAVGVVAVAGDDAGDVRAVTPVVVLRGAIVDEVDKRGDALAAAVGHREVIVPGRDARVDHRDADAGAGVAILRVHVLRADRGGGARDARRGFAIDVDALDLRIIREALEQHIRDARRREP